MRFFLKACLALAFLGVAVGVFVWNFLPGIASGVLISLNNASAGLTAKTIETDIGAVHYLEGGKGETVLLVHGIYARKEHWVDVARELVPDYHVIAIDLPGFGDNTILVDEEYGLSNQSQNLTMVIEALELDRFHLAANSMGAQLSSRYTLSYPERVGSLAFIGSPLGVPSPRKSDMEIALQEGLFPLVISTPEDFHARNQWLSPQTLRVPAPILRTWMTKELAQKDKNAAIWHAVHGHGQVKNLLELADRIVPASLTMWCVEDRIFHISGAEELALRLTDSRLEILEDCGHVPMLDKPGEVARIYRDFLVSQTSNPRFSGERPSHEKND